MGGVVLIGKVLAELTEITPFGQAILKSLEKLTIMTLLVQYTGARMKTGCGIFLADTCQPQFEGDD